MSNERKTRLRDILLKLTAEEENENNEELINITSTAVQEAHSLLIEGEMEDRVKNPGESYLDSRVLSTASDVAVNCTLAVSSTEHKYDRHRLAQHFRENPQFWMFAFPCEVPIIASLHGTFDPTPPEQRPRAARKQVEKHRIGELRVPEKVDSLKITDDSSEMVTSVKKFLSKACKKGPVSYFHVVLDPTSFSRTIENVYYMSFLVCDGHISVFEDEKHGLPFIKMADTSAGDAGLHSSHRSQVIVSLNMKRWRELIDAFGISEPMMIIKRE